MCKMSLERMGGLALIVGPVLAFVMFLLQPGGILIDTAAPSDPIAAINALADNQNLANATVSLVCVGLVLMAFGLYALQAHPPQVGSRRRPEPRRARVHRDWPDHLVHRSRDLHWPLPSAWRTRPPTS